MIQIIDLALHSAFISLYYFADLFLTLHSVLDSFQALHSVFNSSFILLCRFISSSAFCIKFFLLVTLQINFKLCILYSILRLYYAADSFKALHSVFYSSFILRCRFISSSAFCILFFVYITLQIYFKLYILYYILRLYYTADSFQALHSLFYSSFILLCRIF